VVRLNPAAARGASAPVSLYILGLESPRLARGTTRATRADLAGTPTLAAAEEREAAREAMALPVRWGVHGGKAGDLTRGPGRKRGSGQRKRLAGRRQWV
jgi:hypothetical protein